MDNQQPIRRSSTAASSSMDKYGRIEINGKNVIFHEKKAPVRGGGRGGAARRGAALSRDEKMRARKDANNPQERRKRRRQKLLILKEEKDRFDAMREIQEETRRYKQYWALGMAFIAFGVLWCVGALIFFFTEAKLLEITYFEALYFCFVSLLTIG
jgi:potassium channel subfamily K, other eukaryote